MKIAILFWFYKEPEVCKNHLALLKKNNPNLYIFGLFGGKQEEVEIYQKILEPHLDDFYTSPFTDPYWKWINGDLMILDWFEKRGEGLEWDSIAVVQWDMLVFDSLESQLEGLKPGEMLLSGVRLLDQNIESKWNWTKEGSNERVTYLAFQDLIKSKYGYTGELWCCLFIFAVFPRIFLEKYRFVHKKEIGMLEYKIPTYAKIFGIPFYQKDLGVWWFDAKVQRGETPMNAGKIEIHKALIEGELKNPTGYRFFHPYFNLWV